jgi:diguanylate cyclase (GGDEF)-like protein/PAS domain S-box-containing protein
MKFFSFFSLRSLGTNLAMWFCLISVTLTLVLAQVIGISYTAKMREQIGLKLSGLAYQITDRLDQGMYERYREFHLISLQPTLGNPAISLVEKAHLLEQIQQSYTHYSWIGMTDLQGKVLAATNDLLVGMDVAQRPWFGNAMKGIYIGDVHDAKLLASKLHNPSGEPLRFVDIAFPYFDEHGKISGVVCAHMSWKWAEYVQDSVITAAISNDGISGLIVSADGTVLLGPKDAVGTKLNLPSVSKAKAGQNQFTIETWPDENEYLVGYSPSRGYLAYPGLGWSVLVRQDAEEAYAPVKALQQKVLLSGFTVAFLFSLFGLFNARRISQPLLSLAKAARKIRMGESGTLDDIPLGYAEVNELAASMAALVGNLQKEEQALKELNASLEQRVEERTRQLASSETRLRTITDSIPALIAYIDMEERYRFCNKTYHEWFGKTNEETIGVTVAEVIGETLYERAQPHIAYALQGYDVAYETSMTTGDGTKHLKIQYLPDIKDGDVLGVYVLGQDITASKNLQMTMQRDLLTDALTGLPNRTAYLQELNAAIARTGRNRQSLAVMFLDVDKFKLINDSYGHEAGDNVLIEFGLRLQACVRETDTVARLSGDEFVVLLENITNGEKDVRLIAEKLLDAIRQPMEIGGHEIHVSTSIGIALPDNKPATAETLLKKADQAMYEAKHAGRNLIRFYQDPEIAVPSQYLD